MEQVQVGSTKPLIIGAMWDNGADNVSPTGVKMPRFKIRLSRDLGVKFNIGAGTEFAIWKNQLPIREGKQDPQYSISIDLSREDTDREIARQKAAKLARTAQVEQVTQVA